MSIYETASTFAALRMFYRLIRELVNKDDRLYDFKTRMQLLDMWEKFQ